MSKLINAVDNDVVKETIYDKLVTKVNAIDTEISSTGGLVFKTQYDSGKQNLDKKIEDVNQKIPNTKEHY